MSKLFDYRKNLKTAIVDADIGWTAAEVILKRTASLWNDVATAIQASANGAVLHIGVASGERADDDNLLTEITLPITILCLPQVENGADADEDTAGPEEDLWEDLVTFIDTLVTTNEPSAWQFKFKGFTDLEVEADDGTSYLARQTTFTRTLIIS